MTVTTGERIAVSMVSFLASAMAVAYAIDRIGLAIAPLVVLVVSIAAAAATFLWLRPIPRGERGETTAFIAIIAAVFGYLLWLARPTFLPIGGGPDLAHHLVLIDYIERHWRLVHDPGLGAVMGEMADYTPGVHLLAALAGAWTRTDGLHAIYPIVALSVALKAALVFAIATRVLPGTVPRVNARGAPPPLARARRLGSASLPSAASRWPQAPFAIAAVVMLFAPREYFLRSFTDHSFLAQVVSELFAVAMWWALVGWYERPSIAAAIVFAIAGAGAFLTWPVWIGPLLLMLVVVIALRGDVSVRDRLTAIAAAVGPIAIVAVVHSAGRVRAAGIAATSGFVVWPSIDVFGAWFLVLASIGVVVAATNRPARSIVWLLAAIALQAGALFVVAAHSGADRPYLALKMAYLAIYPMAIAGAVVFAVVGRAFQARRDGGPKRAALRTQVAWLIAAALFVVVARPLIKEPRPTRVVSEPMYLAGQWARANVPAECVDYLVRDDDSAYWLHLAVLGNARQTDRTREAATFDPKAALIRWIQPAGLPYAITDDFDALPKDIRTSVDVVRRFGPAAIVKRRGRSTCEQAAGPR